ncbi:MAG: PD-(D/E)XK nuclease family protein [Myxococcota bacterium]
MRVPDHTSAAQLTTYASCPRKYRLRYVDKAEPEFRSPSLVLGTIIHTAAAWWFDQKQQGRTPELKALRQIVEADFTAMTHGENVNWGKWTPGDLRDHAARLSQHLVEQCGNMEVTASELRFELQLYDPETGEMLPRPFVGFFDFKTADGKVVELKTSRGDYNPIQVAGNLQLGGYTTAIDHLEVADGLDLVVLIKNKRPRVQKLELRPDHRTEQWFLRSATEIERAIGAGHFPPSPSPMCASCEFKRQCLGDVRDAQAA